MHIHMPVMRTPRLPAMRRSRRRSTKKAMIAGAPGVLAALGATTWAFARRRSRAMPHRSAGAGKKHKKDK